MSSNIIVVSALNRDLLPEGEMWLVIGPQCWGRSRSLPEALANAAGQLNFAGGQFSARVVPDGTLWMDDFNGDYRIEGWTPEQKQRATDTTRIVAISKTAANKWGGEYREDLLKHRKELAQLAKKKKAA